MLQKIWILLDTNKNKIKKERRKERKKEGGGREKGKNGVVTTFGILTI
jgi:hypothetical protein